MWYVGTQSTCSVISVIRSRSNIYVAKNKSYYIQLSLLDPSIPLESDGFIVTLFEQSESRFDVLEVGDVICIEKLRVDLHQNRLNGRADSSFWTVRHNEYDRFLEEYLDLNITLQTFWEENQHKIKQVTLPLQKPTLKICDLVVDQFCNVKAKVVGVAEELGDIGQKAVIITDMTAHPNLK